VYAGWYLELETGSKELEADVPEVTAEEPVDELPLTEIV
jgi:hypothetical protein